jgi:alpha-N-acetylglucosaminidase
VYLAQASKAVVDGIRTYDSEGVWVMQGWLFTNTGFWNPTTVAAYLGGVSDDGMIILDLVSEDQCFAAIYDNYFGKKWIWNIIHNRCY